MCYCAKNSYFLNVTFWFVIDTLFSSCHHLIRTGVKAEIIGKPEESFFHAALSSLGCTSPQAVMIGDVSTIISD